MIPNGEKLTTKLRDLVTLTTDIFVVSSFTNETLLIKRAKPPFMGKYVLAGGHVENSDTSLEISCIREAEEELGITVDPKDLKLFYTLYGDENRDPRAKRSISIVFIYRVNNINLLKPKAGSDAKSTHIVKIDDIKKEDMGFDHWEVIQKYKEVG